LSPLPWSKPKIRVLALCGIIAARPRVINLETCTAPIERGFALAKKSRNLLLAIESPGGSAAQSDLIGQLLRRKAEETGVSVTAVVGDVGASGYWLACAADRIYANRVVHRRLDRRDHWRLRVEQIHRLLRHRAPAGQGEQGADGDDLALRPADRGRIESVRRRPQ
jgi:hypothetical protein